MKRIKPRHSTVTRRALPPPPPALRPRPHPPRVKRPPPVSTRSSRAVARIIDPGERSLLDVVDNLLNSGVMLNADLMLALANVDLVYIRLSALLCAADRVLPPPPVPDGR